MKAYDYSKLTKYTKSQVNGLTKKLSGFRYMKVPSESLAISDRHRQITKETFMSDLGLNYYNEHYDSNSNVYHFSDYKKITKEQTTFGKAWLKNWFFTTKGSVRRGKRHVMVFKALRPIKAGEQLFIDYNADVAVQATEYVNKNLVA